MVSEKILFTSVSLRSVSLTSFYLMSLTFCFELAVSSLLSL